MNYPFTNFLLRIQRYRKLSKIDFDQARKNISHYIDNCISACQKQKHEIPHAVLSKRKNKLQELVYNKITILKM